MNKIRIKSLVAVVLAMTTLLAIAGVGDGSSIQLTDLPGDQIGPSIDGTIVVYTDASGGDEDVYYTDVTNPGVQVLVAGGVGNQRLHDVSGDRIVYTDFGSSSGSRMYVYDINAGSSTQIVVSTLGVANDPAIDGNSVAYTSQNNSSSDIGVVDLGTGLSRLITNTNEAESAPIVGGHYVVYERAPFVGSSAVRALLYDLQTDTEVDLGPGMDPHTDGTTVVFSSPTVLGDYDIVAYDIATATPLTIEEPGNQTGPHIDGDVITYDDSSSTFDLKVIIHHLPSGERKAISGTGVGILNDVSGRRVAYSESNAPNSFDIYYYEFTDNIEPTERLYDASGGKLTITDPDTGEQQIVGQTLTKNPDIDIASRSGAVRASDGAFFVWNQFALPGELATIDLCTGFATSVNPVSPSQGFMSSLAVSPNGILYGIFGGIGGSSLYTIDVDTGQRTLIGPLGLGFHGGGADFDENGILFAAELLQINQDVPIRLVTVDTNTGAATLVGNLADDVDDVGILGSIAFDLDGDLLGMAFRGIAPTHRLFDIDTTTGEADNFITITKDEIFQPEALQGMGFAPTCLTEVTPTAVFFGDVMLADTVPQFVTLSNIGEALVTINEIVVDDFAGGSFSVMLPADVVLPFDLASGASIDITVKFSPSAEGGSAGVMQIMNSEKIIKMALRGQGVLQDVPPAGQIANILDFINEGVDAGTLFGEGPGNSGDSRLGALQNLIEAAGELIEDNMLQEACNLLLQALRRVDGSPRPPDFIDGDARGELAELIEALRADLGCGV